MKFVLLFIMSFIVVNGFGQPKCKPGYRYVPGMSTTSYRIKGGCYLDSVAKRIERDFNKNMCEEASFGSGYINKEGTLFLMYDRQHKWDDSLGCIIKQIFSTYRNNKWDTISKKEYDSLVIIHSKNKNQ